MKNIIIHTHKYHIPDNVPLKKQSIMFLIRVQFATFAPAIKLYITVEAGYSTEKCSIGYSPNDAG